MAGVATSVPTPDYGIDLTLREIVQRGCRYMDGRLQVDLQLRSTTLATVTDSKVSYDLDVETYDFLRDPSLGRCLLMLLVLPEDEVEWMGQSVDELILHRCGYWHSLSGAPPTKSKSTVRIAIPRIQVVSAEAIQAMFDRLRQGADL